LKWARSVKFQDLNRASENKFRESSYRVIIISLQNEQRKTSKFQKNLLYEFKVTLTIIQL